MDFPLPEQSAAGLVIDVSIDRGMAACTDLLAGMLGKPEITLLDLKKGECIRSFPSAPTQCLAFVRDNKAIVSGGEGGRMRVWRLADGMELGSAVGHKGFVRAIACSPIMNYAASGGQDGEIVIWDLDGLKIIRRLTGHTSAIRHKCLTWSVDGRRILSGSWDGSVRLWDAGTGDELANLNPGFGRVMSIALSPDGGRALSSYLDGPDNPVLLWDLKTKRQLHRFGVPGNPWFAGRQLHVASACFSESGETALLGTVFGSVIVWNVAEWKMVTHNRVHGEALSYVAFAADGDSSISVGCDRDAVNEEARVRLWTFPKTKGKGGDERSERVGPVNHKAEQGAGRQRAPRHK